MKKTKQIALNKLFNLCIILGLFFACVSITLFIDGAISWGLVVGIITALLFILLPALFTPYCYSFDSDGVSLCYVFLPAERYLWNDIYAIEVEDIQPYASNVTIFDFFYAYVFAIKGKNVGKSRFYMKGHIRKSFRTKRLLEKYWDGTITGYLFEDVKKHLDKRRAKKARQTKVHLADEVVKAEREVRAETREMLKPFIQQAKQYNLDVKANYLYITKDFKELNSRPQENYTYTLVAEISHFNETDQNRVVTLGVNLIYVRLGKAAYKGVKNQNIKEELDFWFTETLNEIGKNGIDVYCRNSSRYKKRLKR